MKQQLAHHTVTGCNVNPGDLMASGTISGEVRHLHLEGRKEGKGFIYIDENLPDLSGIPDFLFARLLFFPDMVSGSLNFIFKNSGIFFVILIYVFNDALNTFY